MVKLRYQTWPTFPYKNLPILNYNPSWKNVKEVLLLDWVLFAQKLVVTETFLSNTENFAEIGKEERMSSFENFLRWFNKKNRLHFWRQ